MDSNNNNVEVKPELTEGLETPTSATLSEENLVPAEDYTPGGPVPTGEPTPDGDNIDIAEDLSQPEEESNLPELEPVDNKPEEEMVEEKLSTTVPIKEATYLGYKVVSYEDIVLEGRIMVRAKVLDTNGQEQTMTVLKSEFDNNVILK